MDEYRLTNSTIILPNESNIPLLQRREPREGELVFGSVKIPWPESFLHPYIVKDYSKESADSLKNYLRYRNIPPQRLKSERIAALQEWDRMVDNKTVPI